MVFFLNSTLNTLILFIKTCYKCFIGNIINLWLHTNHDMINYIISFWVFSTPHFSNFSIQNLFLPHTKKKKCLNVWIKFINTQSYTSKKKCWITIIYWR